MSDPLYAKAHKSCICANAHIPSEVWDAFWGVEGNTANGLAAVVRLYESRLAHSTNRFTFVIGQRDAAHRDAFKAESECADLLRMIVECEPHTCTPKKHNLGTKRADTVNADDAPVLKDQHVTTAGEFILD